MIVRRLLIALAVLIALTAIAAGVSTPPGKESGSTPQAAPAAGGVAEELDLTLSTTAKGADRDREASGGDTVRLRVEGDEVDSVELGDLEIAPLAPDPPAVIELLADEPGRYPIRLLDADREI